MIVWLLGSCPDELCLESRQVAGGHGSPDASGDRPGHRHTPGCWAVAKSGIPPREPLFNATICRFPGQWGAEASARAFTFGEDGGVVALEVSVVLCEPMPLRGSSVWVLGSVMEQWRR